MPLIEVSMIQGRATEQKRRLARRLTDLLVEEVGATRERVVVIIHEIGAEDWSNGGRLLADDEAVSSE